MSTVVTSYCGACGAANYGTAFCESCGSPMSPPSAELPALAKVSAPDAHAVTAYAPTQYGSAESVATAGGALRESTLRGLRWAAVGLFGLVQLMFALATLFGLPLYYGFGQIFVAVFALGSGVFAIIAGFGGWATGGRRAGAGLSAIGYLVLSVLSILYPIWWYTAAGGFSTFFASLIDSVAIPALGFASWGLSRPFRGQGWLGGIAIVAAGVLTALLYLAAAPVTYLVSAVLGLLVVPVVIAIPWWKERHEFERIRSARVSRAGSAAAYTGSVAAPAAYGPGPGHTNTLALLALIFGLLGSSILPIVLGHVALGQIARTGEQGRGMQSRGIVLGWIGAAAIVVVLIIYGVTIAALGSAATYYGE